MTPRTLNPSFNRITQVIALTLACATAWAQAPAPATSASSAASMVSRNVKQEARIEQGLKSGQLSTREAAKLQREEARIDHMQAHALKDGQLTEAESQRIKQAQNATSQDIHASKHNEVKGDPNSASSKRMQADVARDVRQQKRIEQGVESGQLNAHEAARMERGQAHVARGEAAAGADGHVGAHEQHALHRAKDRQSHRIHRQKHDAQQAAAGAQ